LAFYTAPQYVNQTKANKTVAEILSGDWSIGVNESVYFAKNVSQYFDDDMTEITSDTTLGELLDELFVDTKAS
jgi:hypothetical protein